MPKIRRARQIIADADVWLPVDGGVDTPDIEICADAGPMFVAGSAVFGAENAADAVDRLRTLAGSAQSYAEVRSPASHSSGHWSHADS